MLLKYLTLSSFFQMFKNHIYSLKKIFWGFVWFRKYGDFTKKSYICLYGVSNQIIQQERCWVDEAWRIIFISGSYINTIINSTRNTQIRRFCLYFLILNENKTLAWAFTNFAFKIWMPKPKLQLTCSGLIDSVETSRTYNYMYFRISNKEHLIGFLLPKTFLKSRISSITCFKKSFCSRKLIITNIDHFNEIYLEMSSFTIFIFINSSTMQVF